VHAIEGAVASSPRRYEIISLGRKPGLVGSFGGDAEFEDLRRDGQVEILIHFGCACSFEPEQVPLMIVRVKGSSFQDVSTEFWAVIEKEIRGLRAELNNQRLREIHSNPDQFISDPETRSIVTGIIQDYLYGGKYDEAKRALTELWPPDANCPLISGESRPGKESSRNTVQTGGACAWNRVRSVESGLRAIDICLLIDELAAMMPNHFPQVDRHYLHLRFRDSQAFATDNI
jgi:hypothetical protein